MDLDENWAVITEAIQTILRRENYPNPFEILKDLASSKDRITKKSIHDFINKLEVPKKVKEELKAISPENYLGIIGF